MNSYLEKVSNFILLGISSFFVLTFLFTRSFIGISIFGLRVGELSMAVSLLALFFYILYCLLYLNDDNSLPKELNFINLLMIISFVILVIVNNGSFISTYTYKASSYIWSFGFFYLGFFLTKNLKISKFLPIFFVIYFVYLYVYAVYDFPQSLINFFLDISDKYEPHKGSDILIMLIAPLFMILRLYKSERKSIMYLLFTSSLFLPLLLYKSRGAFIAFLFFLTIELIRLKKGFKDSIWKNLVLLSLLVLIFVQSSFIVTKNEVRIDDVAYTVNELATYRIPDKEAEFILIYFVDGRAYSSDSNLNWRFQIWQDVVYDMAKNKLFISGYGFNEKIPAMNDPLRAGDDGLNENIHNFLLNVFARGGITHFLLYALLFFIIIKKLKEVFFNYSFMSFLAPLMLASFFDASMENAHFPLILFFTVGMMFNKDKILQDRI